VDTVGGVDVFVDKRMKYTDTSQHLFIDLEPGRRHLDGYNAMCFVRYRKNQSGHGESDDNRQNRQKQLIYAIKDQLVHNPGRIPAAIEDAHNTLAGDITTDEIAVIANYLMDIGNDNVKMSIIPTQELKVEDGYNKYDLTFDRKKTIELLRELKFIDTDTTTYNYDQ
jgi:anionic cell wall polymer biosynthesis LytR-Cps2A-Psr (LCP) family protein